MTLTRFSMMALCCFALAGCDKLDWPLPAPPPPVKSAAQLSLTESTFDQLPGWESDDLGTAVIALQRSCEVIMKKDPAAELGVGGFAGTAAAWQDICGDLSDAVPLADDDAHAFFEEHFTPYQMQGGNGPEGLFTGYYEPTLRGSYRKHGHYNVPIYGRPNDLVNVNLGAFKPDLEGEHIVGRVDKDQDLVPYYDREEIEDGALKKQRKIVWVDNAVDAFFLHIQGSGRINMDNGRVLRVGYAAENGQPYVAIGKALIERGALTKDNVSMQSIRAWLEQHPDDAADVMDINTSYIFFRKLKGNEGPLDGPLGAEGAELTPRRSLAVDRKLVPYGVPVWLDAEDPDQGQPNIQRLMVAQDTGGAITGPVRGDFFWGPGDEAAHKAGLMKSKGHAWVLLPKQATAAEAPPVAPAQPEENRFTMWYNHIVSVLQKSTGLHGQ